MAVRIANLKIMVSATTTGLVSGLSRAGRSVKGFGTRTRAAVTSAKGLAVGLAGLAGVGLGVAAAIGAMRKQFAALDTLAKTASKLGVTSQALEKVRFAAQLTGTEIAAADNAIVKFTKALAEADNGTGEALVSLRDMEIQAKDLIGLPLEEQLLRVADGFGNLGKEGKILAASNLFGRSGTDFVNLLKQGGDALDEMFKERGELGLFSNKQLSSIESANDSMTKFGIQLDFIKGSIAADLSDTLGEIVDRMKEMNAQSGLDPTLGVSGKLRGAVKGLAVGKDALDTTAASVTGAGGVLATAAGVLTLKADDVLGKVGLGLTEEARSFAEGFTEEAAAGANKSLEFFGSRSALDKAKKFFDDVDKRGKKTGEKLKAALDPTLDPRSVLLPQARLQGSAAALSFSAQRQAKSKNALDRIAAAAEKQQVGQEEVAALLGDIEKNTRGKLKAAPL